MANITTEQIAAAQRPLDEIVALLGPGNSIVTQLVEKRAEVKKASEEAIRAQARLTELQAEEAALFTASHVALRDFVNYARTTFPEP